jgi:DNA-binding MarR family transcriptional regulator
MDYKKTAQEIIETMMGFRHTMPHRVLDGISEGGRATVVYLIKHDQPVSPKTLAEALHFGPSRVTAVIDRLVEMGYVERKADSQDHRRTLFQITDKGRELGRARYEEAVTRISKWLELLGEEDAREALRLLKRIVAIAESQEGKPKAP